MEQLIMLGTGNATVTNCYNTCFALKQQEQYFLVDTGGGNGILKQLNNASIPLEQIHSLFITHCHSDHILGAVWVYRMIATKMLQGDYEGNFTIYGHDKVIEALTSMVTYTLQGKFVKLIGERIFMQEVVDLQTMEIDGNMIQFFDIFSTKEKQFGFKLSLENGNLVCLGDEPFNPKNITMLDNVSYLLHEAFCLDSDKDIFHPYEKHHSTAKDAAIVASSHDIKNLVLYHTEEKTLASRKEKYTLEAKQYYQGTVYVPEDLEIIYLK